MTWFSLRSPHYSLISCCISSPLICENYTDCSSICITATLGSIINFLNYVRPLLSHLSLCDSFTFKSASQSHPYHRHRHHHHPSLLQSFIPSSKYYFPEIPGYWYIQTALTDNWTVHSRNKNGFKLCFQFYFFLVLCCIQSGSFSSFLFIIHT